VLWQKPFHRKAAKIPKGFLERFCIQFVCDHQRRVCR